MSQPSVAYHFRARKQSSINKSKQETKNVIKVEHDKKATLPLSSKLTSNENINLVPEKSKSLKKSSVVDENGLKKSESQKEQTPVRILRSRKLSTDTRQQNSTTSIQNENEDERNKENLDPLSPRYTNNRQSTQQKNKKITLLGTPKKSTTSTVKKQEILQELKPKKSLKKEPSEIEDKNESTKITNLASAENLFSNNHIKKELDEKVKEKNEKTEQPSDSSKINKSAKKEILQVEIQIQAEDKNETKVTSDSASAESLSVKKKLEKQLDDQIKEKNQNIEQLSDSVKIKSPLYSCPVERTGRMFENLKIFEKKIDAIDDTIQVISKTCRKNLSRTVNIEKKENKAKKTDPILTTKLSHRVPASQRYEALADADQLPLPSHYRFLINLFNSIDTVAAMLYNRREIITYSKLKPAVQELTKRDFSIESLAQIKTIYPDAYTIHQQKLHCYGSFESDKYELVLTPVIVVDSKKSGRNTPDEENVLKSAEQTLMSPSILIERKRTFYESILSIVREEHEKFLLSLDPPIVIPKEKVARWHAKFDVETCRVIEKAELPRPPVVAKIISAKEVLAMTPNSRLQKAVEKLIQVNNIPTKDDLQTPLNSSTPTKHSLYKESVLKGVSKSLLEKVKARQAANAFKTIMRSTEGEKNAVRYSRLPEIAKILRNIFVTEKKSVLLLDIVVKKLAISYRTNLPDSELIESIKLISTSLPNWAQIRTISHNDYLKLERDHDIGQVVARLETLANSK